MTRQDPATRPFAPTQAPTDSAQRFAEAIDQLTEAMQTLDQGLSHLERFLVGCKAEFKIKGD